MKTKNENAKRFSHLREFENAVLKSIPSWVFDENLQDGVIGNKNLPKIMDESFRKIFPKVGILTDEYSSIRQDWQNFYLDNFSWAVDFSQVIIPIKPTKGDYRLIFIAVVEGMMLNMVLKRSSVLFKIRACDNRGLYFSKKIKDLDSVVVRNTRTASDHYAIWVRNSIAPDQEFLGKWSEEVDSSMKIGITLLERLIFGIKYFLETGSHLDPKYVTLCSGSSDVDYAEPSVFYSKSKGEVKVGWFNFRDNKSICGIRSVISL